MLHVSISMSIQQTDPRTLKNTCSEVRLDNEEYLFYRYHLLYVASR